MMVRCPEGNQPGKNDSDDDSDSHDDDDDK
jgi:hypothetical protein